MGKSRSNILYTLDLGSYSIKLLKWNIAGAKPVLMDAKLQEVDIDLTMSKPNKDSLLALSGAIAKVFEDIPNDKRNNVSVLLAKSTVFTRYVTLPNISPSKIRQIIKFEAEQQIPFQLVDVTWDYAVTQLPNSKDLGVLIVAIRNEVLDAIFHILKQNRIKSHSLSISQISYINLLEELELKESHALIIDLGARTTTVVVGEGGKTWARNILGGRQAVIDQIATKYSVSQAEASKLIFESTLKESASLQDATQEGVQEALISHMETLLNEIKRTLKYYLVNADESIFQKCFITGGGAYLDGIEDYIEKELNIPTYPLDHSDLITISKKADATLHSNPHSFAAGLGLALTAKKPKALSVNLLPRPEKEKQELKSFKKQFFFSMILVYTVLISSVFFMMQATAQKLNYSESAQGIKKTYQTYAKEITDTQQAIQKETLALDLIKRKNEARSKLPKALSILTKGLHNHIWFKTISYSDSGLLHVTGKSSGTLSDINSYKQALDQSGHFKDLKISQADIDSNDKNRVTRTFTMNMRLAKEKKEEDKK